jgi:hypothetical protein
MEMLTITDLQSVRMTCRRLRAMASAVLRRRFRLLLDPFMPNIVVPYHSFQSLHAFIKHELGYTSISRTSHPAIAHAAYRFRKYVYDRHAITLSAPRPSQSVLQIILNAPTTADMVVMSAGGVAWFYPQWFREGIAIRTRSSEIVAVDDKLGLDADLTYGIRLEQDLEFTRIPCGSSCPTLWHHVEDSSLRSFIDWDAEDTVSQVFNKVDIEWRLSPDCTNTRCPFRVAVMSRNLYTDGAHTRKQIIFSNQT